jgi:HD-GYP domain-containing protein (c-di-GMP phosphodiesterase class II)
MMITLKNVRHYEPFSSPDLDDLLNHFSSRLRNHSRRVAVCSAIIAEYAVFLNPRDIPDGTNFAINTHLGAACHDIGKLLLPSINLKEAQYRIHPSVGAEWLEGRKEYLFDNEKQAQAVLDVVRYHHERADGKGFPEGIKAKDIPLSAAICAIANALDYCFCTKDIFYGSTADILSDFKFQEGTTFTASAFLCLEHAWDRLKAQYIKWLPLLDP